MREEAGETKIVVEAPTGTSQGLSDAGCDDHHPDLYAYSAVPEESTLGVLPEDIVGTKVHFIEAYHRDGFLVIENAFGDRVDAVSKGLSELTDGRNPRFTRDVKELTSTGKDPDFTSGSKIPWVQYEAGTADAIDLQKSVLQPHIADRVRKLMGFTGYNEAIDSVVNDERLLDLVSNLLGCDVGELELFQDMALLKPGGGREKPWHQDKAFFNIGLDTNVVGCWIAIDSATCENGCMRIQRGGHKMGPRLHFFKRDYQICDSDAPSIKKGDDIVAVPLAPGGLVLFNGLIPHGTPTNMTKERRRALQFHWVRRGVKRIEENQPGGRTDIFGGQAKGLSC